MKMMPTARKARPAPVDHRMPNYRPDRPVRHPVKKRRKPRKSLWRKALSEAVDVLEDIFD
jgi:hypothetical protein